MDKTVALRTVISTLLKTMTPNVYYEDAPDTNPYPYMVYELNEITYSYGKVLYQLEINVLGYGADTAPIETLADTTQRTLNKYSFINTDIQFTIYQGLRNTIKEEDEQIIRRRLLFEIQLHELKGE